MLTFACNNSSKQSANNEPQDATAYVDTIHTSQSALDYEGTYIGTLPCADCSGIYTELTLQGNNYTLKTEYQGKGKSDGNTFTESGTYSWDKTGRIITLSADTLSKYQVGENILFALDREGNRISGDLADKYILKKLNVEN